jgi:hypothetical protein
MAENVSLYLPFEKRDDEKQIVFGWGSVTKKDGVSVIDLQGDVIEDAELENAVYEFMAVSKKHDEMHEKIVEGSHFVESVVITDEKLAKMFPGETIPQGFRGWWVGIKVTDDGVWKKIKDGVYKGFSITGSAIREDI